MRTTVDQALDFVEQIDWQKVFLNFRAAGYPVSRVSAQVGMWWQTAERYARGEIRRPPTFEQAVRLLDLHSDIVPEKHDLAQLRRR